ncbi:MAG: YggT family protein [Parasphingorhabdus sp.]|jgi:YggT family protein
MGQNYLSNAGIFLVDTVLGMYLLVVIFRFLLQLFRADFYNPLSQFVVTVTNPPLRPLRRFIPGFLGIDISAVVLALSIAMIKLYLVAALQGIYLGISPLLIISIAEILKTTVYIFVFVTFIRAILSWFQGGGYNPLTRLLDSLSEPLLEPIRRALPSVGGLDFSPMVLLILLMLFLKLIVAPIADTGYMLLL